MIYFISSFLVLVRRPCGWGNMTFFIFHVTTQLKCHVTLWVGSPHLKSLTGYVWGPFALWHFWFVTWQRGQCVTWFWVSNLQSLGFIDVCNTSSNSNSNAEVPMLRFTNGLILMFAFTVLKNFTVFLLVF